MKSSLLFLQRTQIQLPIPTWRHTTNFTFSSRGSQHYVCMQYTYTQTYTLIKKKLEVNTGQQDSSVSKGACCKRPVTYVQFPQISHKGMKDTTPKSCSLSPHAPKAQRYTYTSHIYKYYLYIYIWDRVSLFNPGWPWTHKVWLLRARVKSMHHYIQQTNNKILSKFKGWRDSSVCYMLTL